MEKQFANYTHTIFKSPLIQINNINNYHSVTATKDIKPDTLLLIEHCFIDNEYEKNSIKIIRNFVDSHKELYEDLYPRDVEWINPSDRLTASDDVFNTFCDAVYLKIQNNVFDDINGYTIGKNVSYFNHSKNQNATVILHTPLIIKGYVTCIVLVISVKNIDEGEEIFIKYNDKIEFSQILTPNNNTLNLLTTNNNFPPNPKIDNINYNDVKFTEKYINNLSFNKIIKKYTQSDIYKNIVTNHYLSINGINITSEKTILTNDLIKKMVSNSEKTQIADIEKQVDNYILKSYNEICKNKESFFFKSTVFVPSHINYDGQLALLNKCIESLLNQKRECRIYISISYNEQFKEATLEFINNFKQRTPSIIRDVELKNIIINIEHSQTYQMEHIYKLFKISEEYYNDLIFFCDDDDTYNVNRINEHVFAFENKSSNTKFDGLKDILLKYKNKNKDERLYEYWAFSVKPYVIKAFFEIFKNNMKLFKHELADMYFRTFLMHSQKYNSWIVIQCENFDLYNYNENNPNSVCGKITQRKNSFSQNAKKDHHHNLLFYLLGNYNLLYDDYIKTHKLCDCENIIIPEKEEVKTILNKLIYN